MNKRKLLYTSICLCLANIAFVEVALAKNSSGNACDASTCAVVNVDVNGFYDGSGDLECKTIIGSNNADDITGTPFDDCITGNNGNDTIRGGEGIDTIYGGNGNDSLYGEGFETTCAPAGEYAGECDDTIRGNNGKDKIYGENGEDDLGGGNGKDRLFGDFNSTDINTCLESSTDSTAAAVPNCDDTLTGGNGKDKLKGGPGDDSLHGGRGKDRCTGTADDTSGDIASCETTLP